MNPALRRLAQSGGLVAAAFALKYPLVAIPNVEPLTLVFFALGYAHGPLWGAGIGAVSELIFATLNPLGPSLPPVWLTQIVGMSLAGVAGGLIRPLWTRIERKGTKILVAAVFGIAVTLIFDLLTNLSFAVVIGPFWPVMIAAIPFAAVHVASNALLFASVFPILSRWLARPSHPVVPAEASSSQVS
jgi:hypothetical protein